MTSSEARILAARFVVSDAAAAWWLEKRPRGWDYDQHALRPLVNCESPTEQRLAIAVAHLLSELRRQP